MTTGMIIKRIFEMIKQTEKRILIVLFIAALIIIVLILFAGSILTKPSLEGAVFYYRVDGKDSKLFYLDSGNNPQYLISIPSQEGEPGEYKAPVYSYISHSGKVLVYLEKAGEIPIDMPIEEAGFSVFRIIYKPKYVDLKSRSINNINQNIGASGLVFSPDDKKIAWTLNVEELTIQELESAGKKREVWLSGVDGNDARRLAILDDKAILLQRWFGNYIYFRGLKGAEYYSLGRINVKTGRVEYVRPKYCSEDLSNCQNFSFSPSGNLFIYEAGLSKNNEESTELFVGDFNGKKSWQILAKNYISDRLWMPNEKSIIYTEQEAVKGKGIKEKIHLVNLETNKDEEIYSGSYVSQLVPDSSGDYLYFLEKETDEKFNLVELNIKTKKAEILESGPYSQMQIFSAN
jgi:Tol biopolymer transport system component